MSEVKKINPKENKQQSKKNSDINKKINKLFSIFTLSNKEIKGQPIAKIWDLKLDVFEVLKTIADQTFHNNEEITMIEVKFSDEDRSYNLIINGKIVFPVFSDERIGPIKMHKYLQLLSSLNIIEYRDLGSNKIIGSYKANSNFKIIINTFKNPENKNPENNYNEDAEILKRIIILGLRNKYPYIRNFGFSIFLLVLKFYKFKWSKLKESNKLIQTYDGGKIKAGSLNFHCHLSKVYRKNYKKIIKKPLKDESFIDFIEDIYFDIFRYNNR